MQIAYNFANVLFTNFKGGKMPQTYPDNSPYKRNFFRAGGIDQVKLTTGADLLNLYQLD